MNVPLLDLQPQLIDMREEIIEKVIGVIDSTRYIQGPEVEALEREIAAYSGAAYGIGVSSGTDALLVSLMALEIGPGDRVLTSPYSFFATMGVILRLGAVPVFADIDPVTFNIDPDHMSVLLEADREKRIKAIVPVHLYGQCADMQRIMKLAETYRLPVIEDAAQAIGAETAMRADDGTVTWRKAGAVGTAGCFSFFPSKNLGGIGDGGMVVTSDGAFAERLRLLRNHGAYPKYYHALVGGNFRLDPIQAAVLRVKLKHLESWHEQRRQNARRYNRLFHDHDLSESGDISLPRAVYGDDGQVEGAGRNYHIYNQYVIRARKRDELREWLRSNNVASEIYYPLALHRQACLQSHEIEIDSLEHAEKAAAQTLALPIYPGLTEAMQEYVVKSIRDFYR